jgi:NAD(P)-dependent dehydrogenase (short-subunit alcohol dehydrogenase family)
MPIDERTQMSTTTVLDRFRLDGKVAIVTGASSGLGVAFGTALAEERGRRALPVTADVARPEDAYAVVEAAMAEFGHVDVLVNNAGKGTAVPATRETPEQFREVIDINRNGSYWMAQACGGVMKPGSAIINVASVVALTSGRLPQAAYSASKAGVTGLTRDLAVQWTGRKGIRVNALAPGFFPSEMTDQFPDGYIDSQLSRAPGARETLRNWPQRSRFWRALRLATSPAPHSWSTAGLPCADVKF